MEELSPIYQILSGTLAGWAATTTGQPMDLYKTKLQLNHSSPLNDMKIMVQKHGLMSLYRGCASIYIATAITYTLEFAIFERVCHRLREWRLKDFPTQEQKSKSSFEFLLAGSIVGFVSSHIYTPTEYTKIYAQAAPPEEKTTGSLRLSYKILKENGLLDGLRKLYTGHGYTLIREIPGCAIYFGGFQIFLAKISEGREEAQLKHQFLASVLASMTYYASSYPCDTIKSNIQSGTSTFKQLMKEKFWLQTSFRKGLTITLIRGVIKDSTVFVTYENCRRFFLGLQNKKH